MFNRLFSKFGKDQPLDLIALQNDAVRSIVSDITDLQDGEWDRREWVYLAVNHEVSAEDGGRSSTQASVLAHKPDAELEKLGFRLSRESKDQPLDLIALQNDAVRSIVSDITDLQDGEWDRREWVYLAVNHEVSAEDGGRSSTQASVLAHKPDAELEKLGFRLSRESKEKLLSLRDAMAKPGQPPWTILDLTVDRSGQFNFAFGYGPPPRINGNLLHSPLSGLLERYLEEKAAGR